MVANIVFLAQQGTMPHGVTTPQLVLVMFFLLFLMFVSSDGDGGNGGGGRFV